MKRIKLPENLRFGIIICIVLISINFWSFQSIPEDAYNALEAAVSASVLLIVVFNSGVFLRRGLKFKPIVLLFLLLPLLSVVGARLYHDQAIGLSLLLLRLNLFWLFYFVLHIFDIPAQKIIKLLVVVGCVWAFLTIVQQFTYPRAYFYTRGEGSASLFRANIIRFMLAGQQYGTFVLLYFFYQYITTKKIKSLFFVGFILIGLYYYGTRQVAAAGIASMLIGVMLLRGMSKWTYLTLLGAAAIFVIFIVQPTVLTHWVELTNEQMSNDDYVRFLSARFYLNEYWPNHWVAKLLGNGKPHELSAYGVEMEYITTKFGFWRSDVGIIGIYNVFGLFYVLNIVWVILKGVFLKFPNEKYKYLKLPFFGTGLLLLTSAAFSSSAVIPLYCMLYYLIDKAFQEKEEIKVPFKAKSERKLIVAHA